MSKYIEDQFIRADKAIKDLGLSHPFKLENIKLTKEEEADLKKHKAVMVITPKIDKDFNTKDLFDSLKKLWDEDSSYFYDGWLKYLKDDYQEPRLSFTDRKSTRLNSSHANISY